MTTVTVRTNADEVAAKLAVAGNQLGDAIAVAAREASFLLQNDFEATTSTWDHDVEVKRETNVGPRTITISASVDDQIWLWLDRGTSDHWVGPVNKSALRFRAGYLAKTSPGVLRSGRGGPYGDWVFSKGHWVSGIQPRNWTPLIQQRADERTPRIFDEHVAHWNRAIAAGRTRPSVIGIIRAFRGGA